MGGVEWSRLMSIQWLWLFASGISIEMLGIKSEIEDHAAVFEAPP